MSNRNVGTRRSWQADLDVHWWHEGEQLEKENIGPNIRVRIIGGRLFVQHKKYSLELPWEHWYDPISIGVLADLVHEMKLPDVDFLISPKEGVHPTILMPHVDAEWNIPRIDTHVYVGPGPMCEGCKRPVFSMLKTNTGRCQRYPDARSAFLLLLP